MEQRSQHAAGVFPLARSGGEVAGTVDARSLPRLVGLVRDDAVSPIQYAVRGAADARGRPALSIELDGTLQLVCQRCLQPMSLPLASRTLLLVASSEAEAADWNQDEHEVALADHQASADEIVEDEILLSLPLAPRHDDAVCEAAGLMAAAGPAEPN